LQGLKVRAAGACLLLFHSGSVIISATAVRLVLPAYAFVVRFVDEHLAAVRSQHEAAQPDKARGAAQTVHGYPAGQFLAVA
jgi:hypothetical protein